MVHTTGVAVKNPTRRKTPAGEIWGWAWAGTVAMDRSMCAHLPPPETLCECSYIHRLCGY